MQSRAFRDSGHCSAIIGCDDEIGALTAMPYVEDDVHAIATPTLVSQLSRPCVTMSPASRGDICFRGFAWARGLPLDAAG